MPSARRLISTAIHCGLLLLATATSLGIASLALATNPPNVVMFLADDLGWTDWQYNAALNPTGSKVYETPNLLALAQKSVNFTNAYAPAPICSPSRAAILTGQSPGRLHLTNFYPGIPNTTANLKEPSNWTRQLPGQLTVPNFVSALHANNYATGLFGKWHLGDASPTQFYGFDTNVGGTHFGGPDDAGGWLAGPDGMWAGMPGLNTPGQYPADKYLSDAIAEKAGDFIQQQAAQSKPFFMANWDYLVHIPINNQDASRVAYYQNKINSMSPADLKGQTNAVYAAMVEKMDQEVGKLRTRLNDPNQDNNTSDSVLNNTIFIFASDNGGTIDEFGTVTRNQPLREGKGSMYEGGLRVPLMVSQLGNANIAQGSTTTQRTSLYDLYPTIFDMTGIVRTTTNTIDGVSIKSAIEGQAFDRGLLFWHYPHRSNQDHNSSLVNGGAFVSAVADKDWKLIFYYDDRHYELYNLTNDISETTNLFSSNPAIAAQLSQALRNYLVNANAQMPLCNTTAPGNSAGCTVFGAPVALPTLLSSPVPGDYNNDGFATLADYNTWRANFGSTTLLAADGNGNGVVDAGDYIVWRNQFIPGSGSGGAVPEPGSLLLFAVAMLSGALLPSRRRR
jgi:arylsulfatase A-like enzyme